MKILGPEMRRVFARRKHFPLPQGGEASRIMLLAILVFFLGACSQFRNAAVHLRNLANEATLENDRPVGLDPRKPQFSLNVVLRAVPRYVLVVPMTHFVWLWDKPGGLTSRAVRIYRVPSGTPAKMVELEPEKFSPALWADWGLKNHARQPVRWIKVTTLLGEGWVRAEFVEVH